VVWWVVQSLCFTGVAVRDDGIRTDGDPNGTKLGWVMVGFVLSCCCCCVLLIAEAGPTGLNGLLVLGPGDAAPSMLARGMGNGGCLRRRRSMDRSPGLFWAEFRSSSVMR